MEKEDGVWRTIRGRRVFIAKGESLGQAMAKSGKFKRSQIRDTRDKLRQESRQAKTKKIFDKGEDIWHKEGDSARHEKNNRKFEKAYNREPKTIKEELEYQRRYDRNQQDPKNRINENERRKVRDTRVRSNYNRYSDTDRAEIQHEENQKRLADYKYNRIAKNVENRVKEIDKKVADYKAKKQSNNRIVENTKTGERYKELSNGQWRSEKDGYDYYLDMNSKNKDNPQYKEVKQSNNKIDNEKPKDTMTFKEYKEDLAKRRYEQGYDKAELSKSEIQDIENYGRKVKQQKEEMIGNIPKKSYDIADQINKDFEGKDHISREEFDNYLTGKYDDEDADIRGIMSYQGWETKYESDDRANEGDLVRDLPKKSEKKYDPSGLNSKEDYEHDLKWFEDMEKKYPTKEGLAKNEDYQTLKEQYESEYNTKWKSKDDTIKAFKEKKQSNNKVKTNPLIENDKKVNQKTLKEYAKNGLATDISNYDDKQLDKLLKKHGKLEHLKTSHGVYGQNGALFKSGKTGEYFVLTNRSGNWYRLV